MVKTKNVARAATRRLNQSGNQSIMPEQLAVSRSRVPTESQEWRTSARRWADRASERFRRRRFAWERHRPAAHSALECRRAKHRAKRLYSPATPARSSAHALPSLGGVLPGYGPVPLSWAECRRQWYVIVRRPP